MTLETYEIEFDIEQHIPGSPASPFFSKNQQNKLIVTYYIDQNDQ